MKKAAIAFVILNILDLILTLVVLRLGASELNPVMRYMFNQSVPVLIGFKVGLPIAFVALMMLLKRKRVLVVSSTLMCVVCAVNTASFFIA